MTRKTFTEWYAFIIITVDATGGVSYHSMNVLGFSQADCVNIAMQTLDPGQMMGSMERMGTAADYMEYYGLDGETFSSSPRGFGKLSVENEIVPFDRPGYDSNFLDQNGNRGF